MRAISHAASDIGMKREHNEDAFLVDDDLGLYLVCDGMGGHAAGEVASALAVRTVGDHVRQHRPVIHEVQRGERPHADLLKLAEAAVAAACREVYRDATTHPQRSGMGCTLTLLLVAGSKAAMAHVGDTRLYLFRDGAVELLSTDHTMAQDLVRRGSMTPAEARTSRYSNVLTRCVGTQESVPIDRLILEVIPDDVFLLCSDGIGGALEGVAELPGYLQQGDLKQATGGLIQLANDRGGPDNSTAVVVRFDAEEQDASADSAVQEVRQRIRMLASTPLFREERYTHVLRFLQATEGWGCTEGETILDEGQACLGMWLVVSGRFSMFRGAERLRVLKPGATLGTDSLVRERHLRTRLVADRDGELMHIPASAFAEITGRRPWLGARLLRRLLDLLPDAGDEEAFQARR